MGLRALLAAPADDPDPLTAVRLARPEEAAAVAAVHVRAWREGYRGLLPDEFLDALSVEERTRSWAELLARADQATLAVEAEGAIAGFCTVFDGEVAALYVDPPHWRRGLGSALLSEALIRAGDGDVVVWLLRDNLAALSLYRRFGFAADGAEKREPIGPESVRVEAVQVRMRLRR